MAGIPISFMPPSERARALVYAMYAYGSMHQGGHESSSQPFVDKPLLPPPRRADAARVRPRAAGRPAVAGSAKLHFERRTLLRARLRPRPTRGDSWRHF
eukprot:365262-Chlamydomonas_euryale.AAC.4